MAFIDGHINGVNLGEMSSTAVRAAFVEENGDCVLDDSQSWHVFETGAMMEQNILGAYVPAYTEIDPTLENGASRVKQTLHRKLLYLNTKLGRCIRAFEELKKDLETRANASFANASFPPTESEVDELHKLKAEIDAWNEKVEAAELQINPPKPAVQVHIDPAVREKSKAVLETIKSIEV